MHLLSYLDEYSLRNSLLVNREWYKLGSDPKLNKISGREIVEKFKQFENNSLHQKMLQLFDRESEDLDLYFKKTKEGKRKYEKVFQFFDSFSFFYPHLLLRFIGGTFNNILFLISLFLFLIHYFFTNTWEFYSYFKKINFYFLFFYISFLTKEPKSLLLLYLTSLLDFLFPTISSTKTFFFSFQFI